MLKSRGRAVVALAAVFAVCSACGEPETQRGESSATSQGNDAATRPTAESEPLPTSEAYVDYIDDPFETIAAMADESDAVIAGEVVGVESIGTPNAAEDSHADEYVAVTISVERVLAGTEVDQATIGWVGYGTDAEGRRSTEIVQNGVRLPQVGESMLLFIVNVDPALARHLGGVPTHSPTRLDGVAYTDGERVVALGESSVADQLMGRTLDEIAADLR